MSDFDPILAIRRAAMVAVHRETPEYRLREIQRWFSETFHTPLEHVEEMEIEYVCMHYFERSYREMTIDEREDELRELSLTEDQRKERLRKVDADKVSDDAFLQQLRDAKNAALDLAAQLKKPEEPIVPLPVPTEQIPTAQPVKIQQGIEMQFVSEDEMKEMEEWDLLGDPTTRK